MRNSWANYFYYSRQERNGVLSLMTLSLGILVLPKIILSLQTPAKANDFRAFENSILAFHNHSFAESTERFDNVNKNATLYHFNPNEALYEDFVDLGLSPKVAHTIINYRSKGGKFYKREDFRKIYGLKEEEYQRLESYIDIEDNKARGFESFKEKYAFKSDFEAASIEVKLFPFDPNTASENELLALGIEKRIVKNIIKYRENNGHFYKKEDLKKIYAFNEIDFLRLENYVQIIDSQKNTHEEKYAIDANDKLKKKETNLLTTIDINKANIDEWLQLRGIGITFATRIVEQREKLGGFTTIEQLKEIHGIPDSTYHSITPYLRFSTPVFRKIPVNSITKENYTHPYLTRKQVEVLIRYKMNHGRYQSVDDLKKTNVFTDVNIEKLKPYIVFD